VASPPVQWKKKKKFSPGEGDPPTQKTFWLKSKLGEVPLPLGKGSYTGSKDKGEGGGLRKIPPEKKGLLPLTRLRKTKG